MKKIATLGPEGTYSDVATQMYIKTTEAHKIEYFKSIKAALNSIGDTCEYGVLPVENLSEGFVSLVLDHLLDVDLYITAELLLPIKFSYVSNSKKLEETERLFVQFVAKGQCSEFIEALDNVEVVTTESNIDSLNSVNNKAGINGAVVPDGVFIREEFELVIDNINDYNNNQTRFLVFSKSKKSDKKIFGKNYKTSIIVMDDNDHPGFLGEILSSFSKRTINLTSIISRPTKQSFGKYHFFIDFDGHINDSHVCDALEEISKICRVKIPGSYLRASLNNVSGE